MPSVIVPVGLNLGPSYRYVTPPDPTPECWKVRLGQESEELDADEFRVWATAFVDPTRHSQLAVNRETLRADLVAAGRGPADPGAVIDRLLERRLLVEFDPEGDLEKVFHRLTLFPLAEGMGNTPEEPEWRAIGHNGAPVLKLNGLAYGLWAFSCTEESLWHACAGLAEDSAQAVREGEDIDVFSGQEAAHAIAINIPLLVAAGCAMLDPIPIP